MAKHSKISIIIPVYNAEKTIEKALDALLRQTYENWEALVIDNNSADGSAEIIKRYVNRDKRIHYLFEPVKGPSTARNLGLKAAQGEYIMFCASDDWYSDDMCEVMLNTIKEQKVDLVTSEPNIIYQNNVRINKEGDLLYHRLEYFGKFNMDKQHYWMCKDTLWNKIFKNSLIKKYNINFPIGSLFDDAFFILCYCLVAKNFYCLNKKLYNYLFSSSGITFNIQHHKYSIKQLSIGFDAGIKFMIRNGMFDKEKLEMCLSKTKDVLGYPISYIYNDNDLIEMFDYLQLSFQGIDDNLLSIKPELLAIAEGNYDFASACFGRFNEKRGNIFYRKKFPLFGLSEKIWFLGIKFMERKYTINGIKYKLLGKFTIYTKHLKSRLVIEPDEMHIFFAANNRYVKPLTVALSSLLRYAHEQDNINIYILTNDISLLNRWLIKSLVKKRRQHIEFLSVDNKLFASMPVMRHFEQQNYYRFIIPQLKPNLSKALYLDSDIVVTRSLNRLWNTNLGDNYVGAVSDFGMLLEICQKQLASKSSILSFDGSYFNSGVLLINLDLWKKDKIAQKLFSDTIKIKDKILYADQCVLNYTLKGRVQYLPYKYNLQTHGDYIADYDLRDEYFKAEHSPVIIHYTCAEKPFTSISKCEHRLWRQWFNELYRTVFTPYKFPFYKECYPKGTWSIKSFCFPILTKKIVSYIPSADFLKVQKYNFLGIKFELAPSKKQLANIIFYCMWNIKNELQHRIDNKEA